LALRPLADIFPDLRVLRTLVVLRREFGIFSGLMIVAHFIGFLLSTGTPITAVFTDGQFWTWNNFLFWGLLGLFAAIPALVTSNTFSIIRLKRWWKTVQHLAYLFFFFGGMHLFFIGDNSGLFAVLVVGISWLLARFGVKIRFFKPPTFPPTPPSLTPPPVPPIS
jgi:DMSO/TMAO reductase YedYZ heme-binding membrane subunit